jgi:hypothetical protein
MLVLPTTGDGEHVRMPLEGGDCVERYADRLDKTDC